MIGEMWRRNWERVIPFLAFPEDIRRIIYTTNSIEAVNRQFARSSRPAALPDRRRRAQTAVAGVSNAEKKWTYPIREWHARCTSSRSTSPDVCPIAVDHHG